MEEFEFIESFKKLLGRVIKQCPETSSKPINKKWHDDFISVCNTVNHQYIIENVLPEDNHKYAGAAYFLSENKSFKCGNDAELEYKRLCLDDIKFVVNKIYKRLS